MYNFEMTRPSTIADAVTALKEEDAQALGGGQTLIPTLKQRLAMPSVLVSLTAIGEMQGVCMSDAGEVCVGGATTHATVAREATAYPGLAAMAARIGDPAVRNRGTIGGSVANNDPAADYPAACLALGATIQTNRREIAADNFFNGLFDTSLEEGELIKAVSFPVPSKASYEKFPNPASRFALVGVFVSQTANAVRVAVTGAGQEGVFRVAEMEIALSSDFSPDAVAGVKVAPDSLNSDIHAGADYRAHLITVLAKRAVAACK